MQKLAQACLICVVCAVALHAAQQVDPSKGMTLANHYVRLEFEPKGMGLSGLVDLQSGVNHIQPVKGKHLLWEVTLGRGTQHEKLNNNYAPCNYARVEELSGGGRRAILEWNDLHWWLQDRMLSIRVTVDLPPDSGIAQWRISVSNNNDYWGLWSVAFPDVNGLPESGKYDIARPIYGTGGQLLKAWRNKVEGRYPSGNWAMQFLSLTRSGSQDSVYFVTMDPEGSAKDFVVEPDDSAMSIVHYAENMGVPTSDYPGYYPIEFGVYQGTWLEAAQRYRGWALQQKWAQRGKLSQRSEVPDIIKNVGVWIMEGYEWDGAHTPPPDESGPPQMTERVLAAQKWLGVPVALQWYNWHHMVIDNDYPHWFPPRPGFAQHVKDMVSQGVLVMPYINGVSCDYNIPDFDRWGPHAIVDEAGGYKMYVYEEGAGRLLSMCPTQVIWQNVIANVFNKLVEDYGANGVYIDQIVAMPQELCFNKEHGHPLGGGHYWVDGYRDLLRKLRSCAYRNGRNPVITSEASDEVFMDLVDAGCWPTEPTLSSIPQMEIAEIPLMEVVYSGYTIFFGTPVNLARSDRFFRFWQGRGFIDGRQLGFMGLDLFKPENSSKAEYLRKCAHYRVATKQYLQYGRMLEPIQPENSVPTFTEDGFGHDSSWQNDPGHYHKGTAPAAEGRLWQAENGHLAVFLANYTDAPVEYKYGVDPAKFGLKGMRFELNELSPEGAVPLPTVTGTVQRTESLGPKKLKVIEITPAGGN
jgi:hypothetical protein